MADSRAAHSRKRERTALVSVPMSADTWFGARSEVVDWLMQCARTQRVLWFPVEEAVADCPKFAALRQSNAYHSCHVFQQAVALSRIGRATAPSCFLSHPGTAVAVQTSGSHTSSSGKDDAGSSTAQAEETEQETPTPVERTDACCGDSNKNKEPADAAKDRLASEESDSRKEGRMVDDLHNLWGIVLMMEQYQGRFCIPGLLPRPVSKPRTEQGEMTALAMLERNHIPKLAPGYEVFSFQASGSQANCAALLDACGYNCAKAWVANSCYVAGGNNWLREAACMCMEDKQTKQLVQQPQGLEQCQTASGVRRLNLPYFAQELGVSWSSQELREAEERALQYISYLLVNGEMKALLLEVVGCLTGLQLSMRFLQELLQVMNKHGGKLVVDEIMTAGRTGPLFLASTDSSTLLQPHYITLGKWCQQGVVLRLRSMSSSTEVLNTQGIYTGETLGGSIVACERAFAAIKGKLDDRTERCNSLKGSVDASRSWCIQLLRELVNSGQTDKSKSPVFWGKGCIVFANISMPRPTTLRCRFLPTLRTSTKAAAAGHKQVDLAYAGSVNGIPYSNVKMPVVSVDLLEFHHEWMHQMLRECGK